MRMHTRYADANGGSHVRGIGVERAEAGRDGLGQHPAPRRLSHPVGGRPRLSLFVPVE